MAKRNRIVFLCIFIFTSFSLSAQNETKVISGTITDTTNGEELIGATVYITELGIGSASNTYGFYSISVPKGKYEIVFQFIGYEPLKKEVTLSDDTKLSVELSPASEEVEEVTVVAKTNDRSIRSPLMGVEKIDITEVEKLPVLFGEKDVFKTMQLLPGISSGSEAGGGVNVRGGSTDQNLILLDEAPVYNASHLMGFFSVFNSDALKNMTVYKGAMPSEYGGRASSVFDIQMNNGNMKELKVTGGIGLISSRLTVEGPIAEDKVSFLVSGRRTYADLFFPLFEENAEDASLYFYDLNAKLRFKLSDKDQVFLSGYFGQDKFGFESMGMNWGNQTGTLRWNHIFNGRLFSNTSAIYSEYEYQFNIDQEETDAQMKSGINDINFKQDFTYYINHRNKLKFGLNATYHTFLPGQLVTSDSSSFNSIILEKDYALETGIYLSNDVTVTERLKMEYGARFSMFHCLGPGTIRSYDEENNIIDEYTADDKEVIEKYYNLEPRLALTYILGENSSFKSSYNRSAQYLHLASNSTSEQPTDIWIPSSNNVKPLIVDQYSIGFFNNTKSGSFDYSIEGYYKNLENAIDYENGADIMLNEDLESQLVHGKGLSYGAEFLIRKNTGKFTGWIAYTLSKTKTKFDEINNGNWFSAKYDKTHDVSVVSSYQISPKVSLSAVWVYATGNAITMPSGQYVIDGKQVTMYSERNGGRMPEYHRLDLGLTLQGKKTKKSESSWNFSVYNAYGRENAYSISYQASESIPGAMQATQTALFKMIPSVTYNFKF